MSFSVPMAFQELCGGSGDPYQQHIEASTALGDAELERQLGLTIPTPSLIKKPGRSGGVAQCPYTDDNLVRTLWRGRQGTGGDPESVSVKRSTSKTLEKSTSSTGRIATEAGIQRFPAGSRLDTYPTFIKPGRSVDRKPPSLDRSNLDQAAKLPTKSSSTPR